MLGGQKVRNKTGTEQRMEGGSLEWREADATSRAEELVF